MTTASMLAPDTRRIWASERVASADVLTLNH